MNELLLVVTIAGERVALPAASVESVVELDTLIPVPRAAPHVAGTIGAGLQTIIGGNITILTELCERTRGESFEIMLQHASELGANAIIGARYDATEVMQGVTEVLAYGTAVVVEPKSS